MAPIFWRGSFVRFTDVAAFNPLFETTLSMIKYKGERKCLIFCYGRKTMMQGLITVSEAAQLKGVTRSVVYRAIERGDLTVQIVLGRKALQWGEVMAWKLRQAGRRKGSPTSDEAKAKISEAQKNRWQKRKQAKS